MFIAVLVSCVVACGLIYFGPPIIGPRKSDNRIPWTNDALALRCDSFQAECRRYYTHRCLAALVHLSRLAPLLVGTFTIISFVLFLALLLINGGGNFASRITRGGTLWDFTRKTQRLFLTLSVSFSGRLGTSIWSDNCSADTSLLSLCPSSLSQPLLLI